MKLFFIFSLLIAFSFGYDEKIECEFYNQNYPNLTLTKITSLISSKLCDKVCINYLCAVNFSGESDTVNVYALGSGCIEDIVTNCGQPVGLADRPQNIETLSIYTSSCAEENGIKDCAFSLPDMINNKIKNNPNASFGWGKRSDIHYDQEIFGLTTTTTTTTLPSTPTSSGNTFYALSVTFLAAFFAVMFVS